MKRTTYERLLEAISELEVIDAHEHLPPEHVRVEMKVDAFTLFSQYTRFDLMTAGMPPGDWQRTQDGDLPLGHRWRLLAPYLEHIRHGSYIRPALMAAKEFYGFDTIEEKTCVPLSEAMAEANKPGIYQRVLREKCKIRTALTQGHRTDYDGELLVPVMHMDPYVDITRIDRSKDLLGGFTRVEPFAVVTRWEGILESASELGERVNALGDLIRVMEKGVAKWKSEGVVGVKMISLVYGEPDRAEAEATFERLRSGRERELPGLNPLVDFLIDEMLRICAREGLVVAVHAGVWGDFRKIEAMHMIPVFYRHPDVKFDLYHAGMPSVRETGVIGKNFHNVWLNLCWSHIVSPKMARSALDEWLDMVPANKIIAFGGDYIKPVEKVYGHLVMARENIAHVLSGRVEEGLMGEEEAVEVAKKCFYDNPKNLYGLPG